MEQSAIERRDGGRYGGVGSYMRRDGHTTPWKVCPGGDPGARKGDWREDYEESSGPRVEKKKRG